MDATTHFGVYGLWKQDGQMVLIRKSRGPYASLLDLPGGSPEINETEDQTLARELEEECGVLLDSIHRQERFTIHVDHSSTGEAIDLTHSGLIKSVNVFGRIRHLGAFADVASVELFDTSHHSLEELSPLVLEAMCRFPEFGFA
ncbi:NUDIX domain-containing protein [Paeniglutamicibacter sp. NPDC091659]|uniref:NUDIX domain-containing protein n=1 Tax=Paeniglutamicibacter sp. NPDC091659 TaxID=3364389 RepID=UPI0038200D9E